MAWNAKVDKATNELLISPDWNMNLSICDSINTYPWLAKEYVKAVKKRMKCRNPKIQFLAMTILETMVKNCGESVHAQMVRRNILRRMIKIIRMHMNARARDKALSLLDSWQAAFGGPRGKYPQYYWAYEELRRCGVEFPPRSKDECPIITPPAKLLMMGHSDESSTSSNSSQKSDEPKASETVQVLSLSGMESMQTVMELLADMLRTVNPKDCEAIKDEVIVDLVDQCRSNQKKLVEQLTSTGDEKLLGPGVQLNDSLQKLLAKHDAIASGRPLPVDVKESRRNPTEVSDSYESYFRPTEVRDPCPRPTEVRESNLKSNANTTALITINHHEEEQEEDEELVQLIPRRSRDGPICSKCTCQMDPAAAATVSTPTNALVLSTPTNALVLSTPTTPVTSTNNQPDLIDLMSLTLSTTSISPTSSTSSASPTSSNSTSPTYPTTSPRTSLELSPCNQAMHQLTITPNTHGYLTGSHSYLENQGMISYSSYVVPWVQPQPQTHPPPQFPQYSSACSSTPWAMTQMNSPQNPFSMTTPHASLMPYPNASASYMPMPAAIPPEYCSALPSGGTNGSAMYQEAKASMVMRSANSTAGQKQFVPSYKLFEDLDVLGVADGRLKSTSNASPGWSGMSNQPMVGGRK